MARIAVDGQTTVTTVVGTARIGKTTLVCDILSAIVSKHGKKVVHISFEDKIDYVKRIYAKNADMLKGMEEGDIKIASASLDIHYMELLSKLYEKCSDDCVIALDGYHTIESKFQDLEETLSILSKKTGTKFILTRHPLFDMNDAEMEEYTPPTKADFVIHMKQGREYSMMNRFGWEIKHGIS